MDKVKFSNLLRELRVENGLTQQAFADIFAVSFQAVSKWENGESIPDILILEQISDFYNISINNLLNGERDNKNKDTVQDEVATKTSNREEESDFSLELARERMPKLIISSVGLVLYLILCALPVLGPINYYNLVFSGYYTIELGLLNVMSFLSIIASMIIGIISVFKKKNNVLVGIELPLLLGGVLYNLFFSTMITRDANVGCYMLTILGIIYLVMFLVMKKLNFDVLFINKHQNEYNSIPFYVFILYTIFVSFINEFYEGVDDSFVAIVVISFILVMVLYIVNLILFIINFKHKSKMISKLKYILFGLAVAIIFVDFIVTDYLLYLPMVPAIVSYIVLEIVNYRRVKKYQETSIT